MNYATQSTPEIIGALQACDSGTISVDATRELYLRAATAAVKNQPLLDSAGVLADYLVPQFGSMEYEVFVCVWLDVQHRIIKCEQLFRGTLTQTSVYPREVVKAALEKNAAAVIFCHNHPSGNTIPSTADRSLTQTLKSALALIDVAVLDHIIVSSHTHRSMAASGDM